MSRDVLSMAGAVALFLGYLVLLRALLYGSFRLLERAVAKRLAESSVTTPGYSLAASSYSSNMIIFE